jgi:hypothetical protein
MNTGQPVNLYKVKAHSGIIGNEEADVLAKEAGRTGGIPRTEVGENSRQDSFWVQSKGRNVDNLHQALKAVLKQECGVGKANQGSIYYRLTRDTVPQIDPKWSTAFMTNTKTKDKHIQAMLQYRTGTLPTNKLLHRMKLVDSPSCPHCGQMDGGTHMLMECPKTEGLRTERHHDTARLIFRAIAKGRKGGYLKMVDIGTKEKRKADELDQIEGNIPDWIFPPEVRKDEARLRALRRRYRPDGLLIENPGGVEFRMWDTEVYVIEFKYSQDAGVEAQTQHAERQHAELVEMLKAQQYRVKLVPLMIGVGGAIYKSTIEGLQLLGVREQQLKDTLMALNMKQAEWMYTMRAARIQMGKG